MMLKLNIYIITYLKIYIIFFTKKMKDGGVLIIIWKI